MLHRRSGGRKRSKRRRPPINATWRHCSRRWRHWRGGWCTLRHPHRSSVSGERNRWRMKRGKEKGKKKNTKTQRGKTPAPSIIQEKRRPRARHDHRSSPALLLVPPGVVPRPFLPPLTRRSHDRLRRTPKNGTPRASRKRHVRRRERTGANRIRRVLERDGRERHLPRAPQSAPHEIRVVVRVVVGVVVGEVKAAHAITPRLRFRWDLPNRPLPDFPRTPPWPPLDAKSAVGIP